MRVGRTFGRGGGLGAADAEWSPLMLPNVVAYWDLSDLTTLFKDTARTLPVTADADVIKGVTDLSGNGNHLSEATNGPQYKTGVFGSWGAALFDGAASRLRSTNASIVNVYNGTDLASTLILVVKTGAIGAIRDFLSWGDSGSTNHFVHHDITAGGSFQDQKKDASTLVTATDTDQLAVANTKYVITRRDAGTTLSYWRDGFAATNNPQSWDVGAIVPNQFALGILHRSSDANFYNGHIVAGIVCNAAITDGNRSMAERSFGAKFGIAVS